MSQFVIAKENLILATQRKSPTVVKVFPGGVVNVNTGTAGSSNAVGISPPIPGLTAANVYDAIALLTPYRRTFTQADLSVAGILPVTHNLGTLTPTVEIWDDTGQRVNSDEIIPQGVNSVGIDLSTYQPIPGTWTIKISL